MDETRDETAAPNPRVGEGLLDERMGPSSAMAHLYRGEIHRMQFWRNRLDRTTNWVVVIIAAVLTWAFSSETNPHYVLLGGQAAVVTFLFVEARRFRAYEMWRSRVRSLQTHVWTVGLDPETDSVDEEWRERLGRDYRGPEPGISVDEAVAHRLRRVYFPLFTLVTGAWSLRVTAFAAEPWPENAAVGSASGLLVTAAVFGLYAAAAVVCCRPRTWHIEGELLDAGAAKENTSSNDT